MASEEVYHLSIADHLSGKSRVICVYDGLSLREFEETLKAAYGQAIIGFVDENGIIYPISVVIRNPSLLANRTQLKTVPLLEGGVPQAHLTRQNGQANLIVAPMDSGLEEDKDEEDGEEIGDSDGSEGYEDAYKDKREVMKMQSLSLEESIEEMNYLIGFRHVDVRTVLNLLCSSGMYWETRDEWKELPVTIDRDAFVNLVNALAHLVLGKSENEDPDEELVHLLFDVMCNSSDSLLKGTRSRATVDDMDVALLASGLTLLCGGDESENLAVVFSLYSKKDDLLLSQNSKSGLPKVCVYLHLSICFRLVYQLCSDLRRSAPMQADELAYKHALVEFLEIRDREYDDDSLSFREFDRCCKLGFRAGLKVLFESLGTPNADLPPHYDESHAHETTELPPPPHYHESHADESTGRGGAKVVGAHESNMDLPPPAGDHDHDNDHDHDHLFPEGKVGRDYYHHYEVSSEESLEVHDSHFPSGQYGVHYDFLDSDKAREFLRHGADKQVEKGEEGEEGEEGEDNALEDSLIAASLVEYDGGPIDVLKAQQILGFKRYTPDVVLSHLIYAANDDGQISLASYHRLIDQLMRKQYAELSVLQRSVADYIVSTIFENFQNDSGGIRMEQIGWGFLVFCDGSAQIKARAATALMNSYVDTDRQGGLKAGDMIYCLSSVLGAVGCLNQDFIAPMEPDQIATELTIHAFKHAGSNYLSDDSIDAEDAAAYWQAIAGNDGSNTDAEMPSVIPVSDFEHWFGVTIQQFDFDGAMVLPSDASLATSVTSVTSGASDSAASRDDDDSGLKLVRDLDMDEKDFLRSYGAIDSEGSELRSSMESADSYSGGWKKNLVIDTGGWGEEDEEDNGAIEDSEDERKAAAVHPEETFLNFRDYSELSQEDSQSDVPSQSVSYSDGYERASDTPYDSDTSGFEGFNSDTGAGGRAQFSEGAVQSTPSAVVLELRAAAAMLGLDGFPPDDLMEVLGEGSRQGLLSKDRWLVCIQHFVQLTGGKKPDLDMALKLAEKVFAAFQFGDPQGRVNYIEFAAGLSCMCSSPVVDKVMVAFTLIDSNCDGYITASELCSFVASTIRAITACSSLCAARVASAGVPIDGMAAAVVNEALSTFGLQANSPLDLETVNDMCSDYVQLASGTTGMTTAA